MLTRGFSSALELELRKTFKERRRRSAKRMSKRAVSHPLTSSTGSSTLTFGGVETFERVCKEFEKEMYSSKQSSILRAWSMGIQLTKTLPGGYSIYHDHTNYAYDITLVRVNLLANTNERHVLKVCTASPHLRQALDVFASPVFPSVPLPYRLRVRSRCPWAQRLQLYESNATPRLYACFEKHSKPGDGPAANILAPIGSSFDVALDHFKKFFRLKTGKEWDDRFEDVASLQGAFKFATPKLGEAKGVMQDDGLLVDVIDDLDFVERGPNRK